MPSNVGAGGVELPNGPPFHGVSVTGFDPVTKVLADSDAMLTDGGIIPDENGV